ncbi:LysR family transcriptional regulator [Mycolicibacterium goodii]|uniref:LysR family transcriptional regulator n=1 Tax=Mycolicibacterium goodii TaxID=134601 RepID=UPI001BDD9330|nr:LysR family transcriptional regulator [Mycolicibacterium goodii]MBU8819665.1 LysR family transcriptional regulator [Mycolicibacterium goodii]MBU8833970.1 LysR family transcriptional regulator [Mycolicibacterium goodii]
MLSADSLGIFVEVARSGRLTEAAKHLGLDQSTVSRRMSQLERSVGQRLFHRDHSGWTLTDAGIRLLVHAEAVEAAIQAAREDLLESNSALQGSVRVLTPDGFGSHLVNPSLTQIRRAFPELAIELVSSNQHTSLSTREFDVAVSIERPAARAVTVAKLADFEMGAYGAPAYLEARRPIKSVEDLGDHHFVWYVEGALALPTYEALFQAVPNVKLTILTNTIATQVEAAVQGLCLGYLPTWIGDATPGIVRIDTVDISMPNSYWLVVPTQFARLARVRAITRCIVDLVSDHAGLRLAPGHRTSTR